MKREELQRILVRANAFKEGDLLVGGTRDEQQRGEARQMLSALRLGDIQRTGLVEDGISRALAASLDARRASEIAPLSVAEVKHILLGAEGPRWVRHYRDGLTSEAIAAVAKVMTDEQLSLVARSLFNPLPGRGVAVGSPRHFGSRIQPNSPGDDEQEVLLSVLEGLGYGCGDVILGINPASDDVETIVRLEELLRQVVERLELPTRYCVLSDIVKQTTARQRAPVDVGFQSLSGTSRALHGMAGLDVDGLLDLARGFGGLYFETGQGSAVTNQAAEGVDMVTLESRAYGLARYLRQQTGAWMIVNDVAGFIGPEVFCRGEQLLRACLEDTVMAKLHGLTMGLDVCATFHMGIAPAELQQWTETIVERAAPAYLMAVAGNADPMLGYLTTSFREHPRLRARARRQISTAMHQRLGALGVIGPGGDASGGPRATAALYAAFHKAGGDTRSAEAIGDEAFKKLAGLRERGYDLGYGHGEMLAAPPEVTTRLETIYRHGRRALYARLDAAVLRDTSPAHLRVRTRARDRDDYLAHPASGEWLSDRDVPRVTALYPLRRPRVQLVISDGLNAHAVNENLRRLLPPLRAGLAASGLHVGRWDVVIDNGRVRAGYQVGGLLGVDVLVHLIGERPGTGLNTLSAYLTYGRDAAGQPRWHGLDHSQTTAICGIHRSGKPPGRAARDILHCVHRMLTERQSGIALGAAIQCRTGYSDDR